MVRQRMNAPQGLKRESGRHLRLLAAGISCCSAYECDAIDRVILEVGQLSTVGVQAQNAIITLDVAARPDPGSPTLHTQVAKLRLVQQDTTYSDVDISCSDLLIRQPQFACNQGSIAANGGPTGQIAMIAAVTYDASNGAVSFS